MFTSHVSSTPGSLDYLFTAFYALTVCNAAEVVILIFMTFKRYWGCYFWALFVTAIGLIVSTIGNAYYFYNVGPNQSASISLALIGWCGFVNGQAVVLWSRLHIVVQSRRLLIAILVMIIFDAVTLCPATFILAYLGNVPDSTSTAAYVYRTWEAIQLALFTAQEAIISVTYIWQVTRLSHFFADGSKRKIIHQLVTINVIIILMDGVLLVVQFSDNRSVQIPLKGLVYSLKLKLEFAVLQRLVTFAGNSQSSLGVNTEHGPLGSSS